MNEQQHLWLTQPFIGMFSRRCKAEMEKDPHRKYHNWDHVKHCLYHAAFTYKFHYDHDLAEAILCHDVIYDTKGDNEKRSVMWMLGQTGGVVSNPFTVAYHVMTTVEHRPAVDNRMILLDLANFLNTDERDETREKVIQENMLLYDMPREAVEKGNIRFLKHLHARLEPSPLVPEQDLQYIETIRHNMAKLF